MWLLVCGERRIVSLTSQDKLADCRWIHSRESSKLQIREQLFVLNIYRDDNFILRNNTILTNCERL